MGDQLWDPGQEWIQIFDNLLKHPQECQLSWCRIEQQVLLLDGFWTLDLNKQLQSF